MRETVPYRTYRSYIRQRFGRPVLTVPVNGGFSCPNRDGTLNTTGCAFCDNRAFSPVAGRAAPPLEQLKRAVERASSRFDSFIVYLQPFSNTYGPVQRLREVYEPLVSLPGVVGLAIGTRPDCLPDETCEYLEELSRRTYLSVEMGLQSADDRVLEAAGRGHVYADFESAARKLSSAGIEVVAHIMAGLPLQDAASIIDTASKLASLPVHGVKFHQLMIIEGTGMSELYRSGRLSALSLEQYAGLAGLLLEHLRPDQCIHRLVANTRHDTGLLAPLWSTDKNAALQFIHRFLFERRVVQGARYTLTQTAPS